MDYGGAEAPNVHIPITTRMQACESLQDHLRRQQSILTEAGNSLRPVTMQPLPHGAANEDGGMFDQQAAAVCVESLIACHTVADGFNEFRSCCAELEENLGGRIRRAELKLAE